VCVSLKSVKRLKWKKWPMASKKHVHPRPVETYFRTAFFIDSTGRNIAIVHQTQEV
jgi:hypothetical protein